MPTPKQRFPGGHGSVGGTGDVTTTEILRRLANMVKVGKIVKGDPKTGKYDIDFGDNKPVGIEGRTARAGDDQTDDMHDKDEQVIVFSPNGRLEDGIVLGALYKKGNKPFKEQHQKGRRSKDGTIEKHDVKKKEKTTVMQKGAKHATSVGKQKQTVDDQGTRLENDKAAVHVKPDGAIAKVNQSGGVVLEAGGNVYINCG